MRKPVPVARASLNCSLRPVSRCLMADPAADLIPVRALNQVSYCPRLYYLEYVEPAMPTNEYVEDGLFQHRRVSDPNLENCTRRPQAPPQVRPHLRGLWAAETILSVFLSTKCERPGKTAKSLIRRHRPGA